MASACAIRACNRSQTPVRVASCVPQLKSLPPNSIPKAHLSLSPPWAAPCASPQRCPTAPAELFFSHPSPAPPSPPPPWLPLSTLATPRDPSQPSNSFKSQTLESKSPTFIPAPRHRVLISTPHHSLFPASPAPLRQTPTPAIGHQGTGESARPRSSLTNYRVHACVDEPSISPISLNPCFPSLLNCRVA